MQLATNVGKYLSKVTGLNNNTDSNYRLPLSSETTLYAKLSKQWEITKRQITVSFSGSSTFTYDGTAHGIDVTFSNLIASDCANNLLGIVIKVSDGTTHNNVSVVTSGSVTSFIYQGVREIDAATYTVSLVSMSNDNYSIDLTQQASFVINKKTLTLAFSEVFTTGMRVGAPGSYEYTYSKGNQGIGLEITGIVKRGASPNYDAVTLTATSNAPGGSHSFNSVNDEITGSITAINVITGQYTANFQINHQNYALNILTNSKSWKIVPKGITILIYTLDDVLYNTSHNQFTYDGTTKGVKALPEITNVTANTSNPGVYSGDTVSFAYSGTQQAVNANTYNVTVNMASTSPSTNYSVNQSVTWKINQRTATISWVGENTAGSWSYLTMPEVVYDSTAHNIVAVVSNAIAGDTFTFTYTGNTSQTNANVSGTYSRTLTGVGNANYTLTGVANLTQPWKITPKALIGNWTGSLQYVYANTLYGPTLTVSGLVGTDTVSYDVATVISNSSDTIVETAVANCSITQTSAPGDPQTFRVAATSTATFSAKFEAKAYGTYKMKDVTLVSAAGSTNYTLDVDDFEWTIGKKRLSLLGKVTLRLFITQQIKVSV